MGFLSNKRILVTGLLSNRSIAYGVAQAMYHQGAELAFTYQGERVKDRVKDMAKEFGSEMVFPCDVCRSLSARNVGRSEDRTFFAQLFHEARRRGTLAPTSWN